MNWTVSKKAKAFKTSIFTELADYKMQKIAQGMEMIDLSVGSPDLSPPRFVMDALAEQVQDPNQYGYTLKGLDFFNEAVVDYYSSKFNVTLNPQGEVIQVMGSQDGLVHLPLLFADDGDIVLVPDPGYTAYETGVDLSGATPYPMPLLEENQFLPDLTIIPDEIAERATMMILNFPGNPVPTLANTEFFVKVIAFAKKHNIIVVHDFAYCELIFDNITPISFMSIEGAKDVGVEFNSLSKSFNMAGCRIGYIVGNADIIKVLRELKSNLDYGIFEPIQRAAVLALRNGNTFTEQSRAIYEKRRDALINGLHAIGWEVDPPKASMFVWAKIPDGWTSIDFTYALMERAGVVVTPGHAFGTHGEGYVRIALVQPEEILSKAVEHMSISGLFEK